MRKVLDVIGQIALIAACAAVITVEGIRFTAFEPPAVHAQAPNLVGFITYADISGTGSNIQTDSTIGHSCRWIQLVTPSTNSTTLYRWGDTNISGTQGGTIAAGGGQYLPPMAPIFGQELRYDITKLYTRGASNDKISVVCGQ